MYLPTAFRQDDPQTLHALVRQQPLATLVFQSLQGLSAEHIPLLLDVAATDGPHGTLRGHVARANPLWREAAGQPVLAIFHGPQAYVTPSWYATKAATGKVVPTWNYVVVHAQGVLQAIEDEAWLRRLVTRLTHAHEALRPHPWQVDDAPAEFTGQLLRAIVGIEITLTRLQGKWKLSQNRPAEDRQGVAEGLQAEPGNAGATMAAAIMELTQRLTRN